MSVRVVFAGTPEFSTAALNALITRNYEVVGVYTQPDRPNGRGKKLLPGPVKQLAQTHQIPVFQPVSLKDKEVQDQLLALKPEIMIVVAYGLILPEVVLNIPRLGCINIHASLLPRWRGAAPIQRAIESGDKKTGVCIMQMDKGLDTGPVWHQREISISETMTAGILHDGLQKLGAELLLEALPEILSGQSKPKPQSLEGITYAAKIDKSEAKIDWTSSTERIIRKILAFNPVPGAFSVLDNTMIKIWQAVKVQQKSTLMPGTLIVEHTRLYCVTGDQSLIEILNLQLAGKKAMSAEQVLAGNSLHHKVFQ